MTQEEKQLLLKDLCARLPYSIMADCVGERIKIKYINPHSGMLYILNYYTAFKWEAVEVIRPYLRSMSSMTEEEKELCRSFKRNIMYQGFGDIELYMNRYVKWLDSEHFDWRTNDNGKTLIELGLALEAPKDMYKFNN